MYGNVANKNNSINFGLRIRLSDKGLLNLSQKPDILYASTPLDFFYREPKNKQKLDAFVRENKMEYYNKPAPNFIKRLINSPSEDEKLTYYADKRAKESADKFHDHNDFSENSESNNSFTIFTEVIVIMKIVKLLLDFLLKAIPLNLKSLLSKQKMKCLINKLKKSKLNSKKQALQLNLSKSKIKNIVLKKCGRFLPHFFVKIIKYRFCVIFHL